MVALDEDPALEVLGDDCDENLDQRDDEDPCDDGVLRLTPLLPPFNKDKRDRPLIPPFNIDIPVPDFREFMVDFDEYSYSKLRLNPDPALAWGMRREEVVNPAVFVFCSTRPKNLELAIVG